MGRLFFSLIHIRHGMESECFRLVGADKTEDEIMRRFTFFFSPAGQAGLMLLFLLPALVNCQSTSPAFNSIPAILFDTSGPVIRAHSESEKPFTVAGEGGVVLGQQNGTFEAWVLPVKLLSHLTIEADIEGYTVPIDVNQQASEIEVRPDRTVITYSHIGFTVRQIMFSPAQPVPGAPASTGPIVLFQFDCVHPTEFVLRFTPELRWMWPERNEGVPGVEWVSPDSHAPSARGGFYIFHADYPDLAGAITIPGAQPGVLAPYQERPQVHPVEFHLHIDPARDRGRLFPLLMATGMSKAAATNAALGATLAKLNASIADAYKTHADSYRKLLESATSIRTPDPELDEAFQWAVISIEQLKTNALPDNETALVAGYFASADSARPGFGWFFGRDALYTLFAVNGYGDFSLSKSELEFLIKRQREDGKIMHEYSQTAAFIDWRSFPYMYAAADATPLFLLAVTDYVRASGDVAFLNAHGDAIEKAWSFETSHADPNGIYSNAQGTGWVESWPGGMPHQEVYLAFLDQQASGAMAQLEELLHDPAKMQAARSRAETIAKTIQTQFYDSEKSCYAFSRNVDGTLDRTSTVYPALGWWSGKGLAGDASIPRETGTCLQQLAGHALNTDWGLRDVSNDEKIYDGMSYHQGSVWPLFTGWAALAEYRGNQPLAGYQMLMENANLTRAQDLGAVTELLSGDFFVPFGRSTSHQLWSSAMVITPTLRGLFGIDIDAQSKTITVNPHLPASWDAAEVRNIRVGDENVDLSFVRANSEVVIRAKTSAESGIKLRSTLSGTKALPDNRLSIPTHPVEVGPFFRKPIPGDRTQAPRVLSEEYGERKLTLIFEGSANSQGQFPLFVHTPRTTVRAERAKLGVPEAHSGTDAISAPQIATVNFPPGEGWKTVTVTFTW
jgi:glycogen debranching enzyme